MHRGLVALAAVLMLAAPAMAAEQYENVVWADGEHVAPGGGLDLLELRMWEADLRDGGPGIMLRFLMESRASTGGSDELHINGTILGLGSKDKADVHLWTADQESWQADQRVVHQQITVKQVAGQAHPLGETSHDVWVFVPLSDLGSQVGQRVDGFVFDAYSVSGSDWSRIDTAPGGYWLPGSDVEMPEPGAAPEANALSLTAQKIPSYFLEGAGMHLNATGGWADGIVTIEILNPYDKTDQTIDILAPEAAKPLGAIPTELKAGKSVYAIYQVPRTAQAQDLVWDIRSHFGGVALMELSLEAQAPVEAPEPQIIYVELERQDPIVHEHDEAPRQPDPVPEPEPVEGKDSPVGAVAIVALVAALAVLRRRR